MNTEEGIIIKLVGNKARVMVQKGTMCDGCGNKHSCLAIGEGKDMEALVNNTAGGQVGDRVLINIQSSSLLKITFLFYIIPVFALLLGAYAGYRTGPSLSINSDLASVLLGLISLVLTFLIVQLIGRRLQSKKEYMPEIVKIILKDAVDVTCLTGEK